MSAKHGGGHRYDNFREGKLIPPTRADLIRAIANAYDACGEDEAREIAGMLLEDGWGKK